MKLHKKIIKLAKTAVNWKILGFDTSEGFVLEDVHDRICLSDIMSGPKFCFKKLISFKKNRRKSEFLVKIEIVIHKSNFS